MWQSARSIHLSQAIKLIQRRPSGESITQTIGHRSVNTRTQTLGMCQQRVQLLGPTVTRSFHTQSSIRLAVPIPQPSKHISSPIELTDGLVNAYAEKKARPVSLNDMVAMGSRPAYLLTAAQWLWAELPVRLAKRLRDLEDLPFGLTNTAEVQQLTALYRASLRDALSIKSPQCSADELQFTEVIKEILTRHQQVVVDLASGVNGGFLRSRSCVLTGQGGAGLAFASRPANQLFLLQELLDRFNAARIGLRMLMAQHVALHTPQDGMVGVIELACSPERIIRQSIKDADEMCRLAYGFSCTPKVEITDVAAKSGGIKPFAYVPAHLRFMVFELLKNAMKATFEHARKKKAMAMGWNAQGTDPMPNVSITQEDLPPIQVVIVDGPTDVTIKISDRGGGIKRSELPLIFTYTYSATQKGLTQAQHQAQLQQAQQTHQLAVDATKGSATSVPSTSSPPVASSPSASISPVESTADWMTGANFQPVLNTQRHNFVESFGLPITRLYSRHFGGDLQLYSLNGHGTDAFLYISRQGDSPEPIQD